MWGSVTPNDNDDCSWEHAPFNNGSINFDETYFNTHKSEWLDENDNLKPEYDAAYQATSGKAHIPTSAQLRELVQETNHEWVTNYEGSGVNGRLFVSKTNGNSIFIPASGSRWSSMFDDQGNSAVVWSSSLSASDPYNATYLFFNSYDWHAYYGSNRLNGYSIRPVKDN